MKQRFILFVSTLVLSVFFAVSSSAYDVEVDGIYYNLNKTEKTAEVSGYSSRIGDVIIPKSIVSEDISYVVSSIGDNAFAWLDISSVIIPNSVTRIGKYAFSYCGKLTSVSLSDSLKSIGAGAFCACRSLPDISIPNSVTSIGDSAFRDCHSLTSFTIPELVTIIESDTFCWCKNLGSITIPKSVTQIGCNVFCYTNLTSIYCYAETVPNTSECTFDYVDLSNITLFVPQSAYYTYLGTEPWSEFGGGFGKIEYPSEIFGKEKCQTPCIYFSDGKLTFTCATEDVKYESEVKCSDVNKYYTDEINFTCCYDIAVTAKKMGYYDSDIATAKLYWLTSSGSLDSSINAAKTRGIVVQSAAGFITISGLDSTEQVDFFASDGKSLGSAKAMGGTATFAAQSGSVVVAKIGKESVKIAVE